MSCIAIDCRFASTKAGLGAYTRGIVPHLIAALEEHHICLFVRTVNEGAEGAEEKKEWLKSISPNVTLCEIDAPHYSLREQLLLPRRLKQLSVDLLYAPHFNVPLFSRTPFVATVHDLTLHHFPNSAGVVKRLAYKAVIKHAVTSAKACIAVSRYTQQDVAGHYGVTPQVVTEGYGSEFKEIPQEDVKAILGSYGLLGDYFLYVGGSNEHKNIQMLIDAHSASSSDTPLVLATNGKGVSALELNDNVTIIDSIPHCDLPALYSGAKCFVTASLYEGFCLPILEARACGTPVIASNVTAISEVAGAKAMLVEPTIESFAKAFSDPPTFSDAPEPSYSWQAAAKQISVILEDALHG